MRKVSFAILGMIFIGMLIAPTDAFEVGENRLENSGFEMGEVGAMPDKWELKVTG